MPDDHFKGLMKQGIGICDGRTCYLPPFKDTRNAQQSIVHGSIQPRIPDHFKTEEMCNKVVRSEPYTLRYVPDHLKTQEMCNEALPIFPNEYK